ncbi:MAG: ATP-grasp domain-containing protein [Gemmatimonadota bacterium]
MISEKQAVAGRRVLITDGEQRAALAIVRSLGLAGAVPYVCSRSGRSLAGASRFAATDIRTIDPLEDPDAFTEALPEILRRHSIDCLLPVTESALRPILGSSHLFRDILLPFPSHDTFSRASDKRQVMELATDLSVPAPRQILLTAPGIDRLGHTDELRFPLVLKPGISVADDDGRPVKLSVRHVADREECRRALAELPTAAFPLLVQERVAGVGVGIFLLRWNGRTLARFAHRRLREKPPSGGVSVYRESIVPPADALVHAEALLEALDWRGVAMIEFKYDDRTGIPYLMEINGRFWGSLQLAIDAGVDFPRLLIEAARGNLPAEPVEGRPGVRLRWLLGDFDHLLLRFRKSPEDLSLGSPAPGRLRTLGSILVPWRPLERLEVLRRSDPRPFVRELGKWFADAWPADTKPQR